MRRHTRQVSRESATSQRSLPSVNDPVLASVLKTSIAQSRASSLHNLPIGQSKKEGQNHPFRRWLTTLHQRSLNRKNSVHPRRQRWKLNEFENDPPSPCSSKLYPRAPLGHRKSSSWNSGSTALLAGTRSAFASMSILSEHRHSTSETGASRIPRSRRSNTISSSADIDSEGLRERSLKRRQIIDEIVHTEGEYISSLKALDNLYRSLCITATEPLKSDMNQMKMILGKLTDLHHDLAHALQEVRGNSRDTANPKEAAEIAVVFGQIMHRFFLYEEFGSKYEEMLHNVGLASQNISDWENYQRGFEKLNNSIVPTERGIFKRKKSLTFGDLHIKPIQRVCKYPLLFADLCKNTPVIDGPDEHLELEKVLFRLRDTVMEINQATIDPEARERMQKSWKLQDMLTFPDVLLASHILRSLGHAGLCGALYVVYRSGKSAMGEYMLCALYKSYLILAIPIKQNNTRKYRVVASIALANIKIHSADCEFGLCCLMAPHVWKILFEIDSAIFEILVVATSVAEKERWTQAIRENTDRDEVNQDQFSMISLNTSSLGSVIGKPGSLLRSMAMKDVRAAKRQIIIRSNVSDCTGHVSLTMRERFAHPVLTPRRSDWARIERDLETAGFIKDVQRDASSQKSRLLRSSASTLLRKLSRSSKKRIDEVSAC